MLTHEICPLRENKLLTVLEASNIVRGIEIPMILIITILV